MALLGAFPYSINDKGEGYIFSALDVKCSRDDFEAAQQDGVITQTYHTALLNNMYTSLDDGPKAAYWTAV